MFRLAIFLLCTLLSTSVIAQKIMFTEPTNKWKLVWFDVDGAIATSSVSYVSDTIVNGYIYRQLSGPHILIRDDTPNHKVYAINLSDTDTTEKILYDYTLQVGDTFKCAVATHVVASIDSVLIGPIWHRVWSMQKVTCDTCPPGYLVYDYQVIEGIGSTWQPAGPLDPTYFEGGPALVCFHTLGNAPPLGHKIGYRFDNITSCFSSFGLYTNETASIEKTTTIQPNPATAAISIIAPAEIKDIAVLDMMGRETLLPTPKHGQEIKLNISNLSPGIYFLKVNGIYVGKFLKE